MARKRAKGVTRGEILDAGLKLIMLKGPEVTVLEIAAAADVSRQMLYQYFGSRGGLLIALTARRDEEYGLKESLYKAIEIESAQDRLSGCLKVWLNYVNEILPVAIELNRLRYTDADAAAAWDERMQDLHSWIRDLVVSLHTEKSLKSHWTVATAADFIFATASVQLYEILTLDRKWSRRKTIKTISETLCVSLLD
jgi:AcrR family transcriptional regulator